MYGKLKRIEVLVYIVILLLLSILTVALIPKDKPTPQVEIVTQEATKEIERIVEVEKPLYQEQVFIVTAYCPCKECCGKSDGVTFTGTNAKENHTIAVDPEILPYGTVVEIAGIFYVAEDCGGGIKGNKIDIYFNSHNEALEWGRKVMNVKVYSY